MIESTEYLTHKHFGKLLSDPGVEILDPCTGTGTYITELIEYLPANKLEGTSKNTDFSGSGNVISRVLSC